MRLIVTHEQPDFDALASLALAKLLFPGARATVQGGISPNQQGFLKLYRDVLAGIFHPSDDESVHGAWAGALLGPVVDWPPAEG